MTLTDVDLNVIGDLDDLEEILRCVRTIIMTPAGTVPLDRDFGIDLDCLDMPAPIAQNALALEIVQKVETYEPRVKVSEASFYMTGNGQATAKVVLISGR